MLWAEVRYCLQDICVIDLTREKLICFVEKRSCVTQMCITKIRARSILALVVKWHHHANILFLFGTRWILMVCKLSPFLFEPTSSMSRYFVVPSQSSGEILWVEVSDSRSLGEKFGEMSSAHPRHLNVLFLDLHGFRLFLCYQTLWRGCLYQYLNLYHSQKWACQTPVCGCCPWQHDDGFSRTM